MRLEFDNIREFEDFIKRLGYTKENKDNIDKNGEITEVTDIPKTITITKKECPYGFLNCPYNKNITPYYPDIINQPYCGTIVDTSQSEGCKLSATNNETVTINMKDIKKSTKRLDK